MVRGEYAPAIDPDAVENAMQSLVPNSNETQLARRALQRMVREGSLEAFDSSTITKYLAIRALRGPSARINADLSAA